MEGVHVDRIVVDTGCSQTMVRQDLVPERKVLEGDVVTIRCAHGDTLLYPVAQLDLEIEGRPMCVKAAVSKTLQVPVLLGTDVPELRQLLGAALDLTHPQVEECMVVIRARAIQQLQEDTTMRSKEQQSGTQPHELLKVPDKLASIGGEFDSEIFSTSRVKVQKTKREK